MPEIKQHSFIVAAIIKNRPVIALVSNFERVDGTNRRTPERSLFVTQVRPTAPTVIVTGQSKVLGKEDHAQLIQLLREKSEPEVIRRTLAEVNSRTSNSPQANNTISNSCLVYSLLPDNTGAGERYGDVIEGFNPRRILNGLNISSIMTNLAKQVFDGELKHH